MPAIHATTQPPSSKRALAAAWLVQVGEDLRAIGLVVETCRRRLLTEKTVPSAEKPVRWETTNARAELMKMIPAYNFDQIISVQAGCTQAAQDRALRT